MIDVLCECNRYSCSQEVAVDESVALMAQLSRCVIVIPGHEEPGEEIIRAGDGWIIVIDSENEGNL